jgi:hypothetical protein
MPYDSPIGINRKYNGQTIKDTNEVIIRNRSKKDRKYNGKKIEDTNEVIIRHRSKKNRKYNGKKLEDANEVIHCILCPSLIYAL